MVLMGEHKPPRPMRSPSRACPPADFGISKVLEKTADFATTVTGTPYYSAFCLAGFPHQPGVALLVQFTTVRAAHGAFHTSLV